jgi:hypothetical protein
MVLIGAGAMVIDGAQHISMGSAGALPSMANVSLTLSSTDSGLPINLPLSAVQALEPDHFVGEAPIGRLTIRST